MALLNWLKKRLSGDNTAKLKINPEEDMLLGMSLKKALDSHTAWNGRLKLALKNQGDTIDVGMVASDHRCELGKWIHGPAQKKFSKHKEYEHAKQAHQDFHLTAAEVLIEQQSGNHDHAEALLKGKFRTASNKIQLELVRLFTTENS